MLLDDNDNEEEEESIFELILIYLYAKLHDSEMLRLIFLDNNRAMKKKNCFLN